MSKAEAENFAKHALLERIDNSMELFDKLVDVLNGNNCISSFMAIDSIYTDTLNYMLKSAENNELSITLVEIMLTKHLSDMVYRCEKNGINIDKCLAEARRFNLENPGVYDD